MNGKALEITKFRHKGATGTYLLTYLLAFKEPGGSLPPSRKPAIGPYPEQD